VTFSITTVRLFVLSQELSDMFCYNSEFICSVTRIKLHVLLQQWGYSSFTRIKWHDLLQQWGYLFCHKNSVTCFVTSVRLFVTCVKLSCSAAFAKLLFWRTGKWMNILYNTYLCMLHSEFQWIWLDSFAKAIAGREWTWLFSSIS
jgi:hypothetical protein